jgi:hypothetical protein
VTKITTPTAREISPVELYLVSCITKSRAPGNSWVGFSARRPIPTRGLPLGAQFVLTGDGFVRSPSHSFCTHRVGLGIGKVQFINDLRREPRRALLRQGFFSGSFRRRRRAETTIGLTHHVGRKWPLGVASFSSTLERTSADRDRAGTSRWTRSRVPRAHGFRRRVRLGVLLFALELSRSLVNNPSQVNSTVRLGPREKLRTPPNQWRSSAPNNAAALKPQTTCLDQIQRVSSCVAFEYSDSTAFVLQRHNTIWTGEFQFLCVVVHFRHRNSDAGNRADSYAKSVLRVRQRSRERQYRTFVPTG